jgi:tol-pal system protein YbgF
MAKLIRPQILAALVAAFCFSDAVFAQGRLSLAERVARLEQQQQGGSTTEQNILELMTRLNELQSEVQSLRGLVEQQNFEIEALKKRARDQYLDLDSRIQGLSQDGALPPPDVPPTPPDTSSDPMLTGEPEPQVPPISEPSTRPEPDAAPSVDLKAQERRDYESAFDALKSGKYQEASRLFSSFLRKYPDGEFRDNATYWLGESYYVTQNFKIALETFQKLMAQYPNSGKAPDALLKIGYCHQELGDRKKAAETLRAVIARYANSPIAQLAQNRLRQLELEAAR